jgi:hypothetical protein
MLIHSPLDQLGAAATGLSSLRIKRRHTSQWNDFVLTRRCDGGTASSVSVTRISRTALQNGQYSAIRKVPKFSSYA